MPVVCTRNDIGKIIYGKWIIGTRGSLLGLLGQDDDDGEQLFIAYKLVGGSFIQCDFDLDATQCSFIKFHGFDNWIEKKGDRGYDIIKFIDNWKTDEPEYDYLESGLCYIKMPA